MEGHATPISPSGMPSAIKAAYIRSMIKKPVLALLDIAAASP
jgi:hypothetical protein